VLGIVADNSAAYTDCPSVCRLQRLLWCAFPRRSMAKVSYASFGGTAAIGRTVDSDQSNKVSPILFGRGVHVCSEHNIPSARVGRTYHFDNRSLAGRISQRVGIKLNAVMAAMIHQPRWKAATCCRSEVGEPTTATKIATPMAMAP
jgi:hypothetical protein